MWLRKAPFWFMRAPAAATLQLNRQRRLFYLGNRHTPMSRTLWLRLRRPLIFFECILLSRLSLKPVKPHGYNPQRSQRAKPQPQCARCRRIGALRGRHDPCLSKPARWTERPSGHHHKDRLDFSIPILWLANPLNFSIFSPNPDYF